MQKYTNAIQDVHGNAVAGATIAVYLYGTLTPATIYSDNGSTVIASSSVTSDSTGEFYFYAANGRYTLSVSAPQFASEQVSDVYLYDPTVANVADKFTATAGQTVFTLSNAPGDIDALLVALNGSVLTPDVDFTLSGVTLTLTVAAAAGDYLVSHYGLPTSQQVIAAGAVTDASVSSSSKLYNRINDWVSVKDFGAVGNGTTDDTAAIQAAINASESVYFPAGTYMCANILMKSNLRLYGESHAAVLKLLPNATTYSINGSVADGAGVYAANVICSTLTYTGGAYYDAGVRAKDPNNSTYIFENVVIENLTIDGNKANNQVGDTGNNASAMGACVNITLCKNVTVRGCRIINARLDGVFIGYTLCGGSDYCTIENNYFSGNQRTSLAIITGKYNSIVNNSGTKPTGGTGVGAGPALDIEPNWNDEICYRHSIVGNRLGGALHIVCAQIAIMDDTTCSSNVWIGGLLCRGYGMTQGVVIQGDTFIAESTAQDWFGRPGPNISGLTWRPTLIKNCSINGFGRMFAPQAAGQMENFIVEGCSAIVQTLGTITRGYRVIVRNNAIRLSGGHADAYTLGFSNTLGGTVPNQGQILFEGNRITGASAADFIYISRDTSWAQAANDYVFRANVIGVSGATNLIRTPSTATFDGNQFNAWEPIRIDSVTLLRFRNNDVVAASAKNLFSNQSGTFTDVEIVGNNFTNVTVNVERPKDCTFADNRIVDGLITFVYSFTSSGVGRNHVAYNRLTAKGTFANPFTVTTGSSFSTGDFVGNDQYKYNVYTDYTAGATGAASIAAGMAGVYNGTFD